MGNLSLQAILSSSVAKRRFLLRPAEPDWQDLLGEPHNSIYFGRTQILRVPVHWDYSKLTNPHLAIVGMTGSGKSYFIKTFITRASMLWGTNALILDWSGEYTPWVKNAGGTIVDFSKGTTLNILDCRPAQSSNFPPPTPAAHVERVINAISIVCGLSKNPLSLMRIKNAIKKSYSMFKISLNKPIPKKLKKLPTLHTVLGILKKEPRGADVDTAIFALEKLCSQNSPFISTCSTLNLQTLTSCGLASINLSTLATDEHRSLTGLILLQFLKEQMRQSGTEELKSPRFIIVADEAWKIAQDENSDLVQILREGRKYSFSLVVASQNPTDISKTILSNSATLMIFRLLHHEFRKSLLDSLNLHLATSAKIEKFPVGRALCRFALKSPGAYDGPFIISKIEGEEPQKSFVILVGKMQIKIQKKEFSKKLWRLGLTDAQISQICCEFEQNDHTLSAQRLASTLISFGLSRSTVLSFLRDVRISDSDLLGVFSRLEANRMGVSPSSIVNLVVSDAKKD